MNWNLWAMGGVAWLLLLVAIAPAVEPAGANRLRVLSYNIHHGEGVDGRLDLERIARAILSAEPDVVALQEVDQRVTRTRSIDQPAELARLTKMQVAFGGNIALQGGEYGNAVLSRHPIRRQRNHQLPNRDRGEQRGVMELEIDVPGWPEPLWFFATHLDHRMADEERWESAQAINRLAGEQPLRPAVLAGDLNATLESRVLKEFQRLWWRANDDALPTIPVGQPTRQIDFVLARPAAPWKAIETKVLDEATASDHRPILAVLALQP